MANKKPQKIFIVAGEESGDLHGSKLVHAMKKHTTNIQFTGHYNKTSLFQQTVTCINNYQKKDNILKCSLFTTQRFK